VVYRRTAAVRARQERTRAVILRAARTIVAESGLAGANMADVARQADVAVGTVYRYFPSKAGLLTEVVRDTCRHELDVVREVAEAPGRAADRLHAAVTLFAQRALRSGRVAFAMIAEPATATTETLRLSIRADLAAILATVVAGGLAEGELPDQDPTTAGVAVVGAVSEVLVARMAAGPARGGDAALVATIGEIALRLVGAAARSGAVAS
jgi:AcrR family transcriptional regulator